MKAQACSAAHRRSSFRWSFLAAASMGAMACLVDAAPAQSEAVPQAPPPSADVAQTQSATVPSGAPQGGSGQLGEIIVTANRRAETVQKSSLAVQAFDPGVLRRTGLTQAIDLTKLTQGLQVGNNGSASQIYIRGVGDTSGNALANPGVSFNVDGVYVGRPEAVGFNFFDISRLEVVKGPQGTLYGRNATGGAINLLTNNPTFERVGGTLNAEVGNYSLFHIDGAINVPLGDTLAFRAAFNRIRRDGYLSDGTNDDNQTAGRAKLLFKPSDRFSLLLSVDGARVRGNGGGYVFLPQRPGSDPWEGATDPASQAYAHSFNPLLATGGVKPFAHNNFYDVSAQLDWNLGFANLTVIPAYRHSDFDTLSYDAQRKEVTGNANQESLEARLGNSNESFKWVAGLYYYHEKNPGEAEIFIGKGLFEANYVYRPEVTSVAAFGEATYSITHQLRVIAGARYTVDRRTLGGGLFESPNQDDTFVSAEPFSGRKIFRAPTWKAGVEYDVAPRSLLFFTASTGFKSGGLNPTVAPDNVYQPEKIRAFELGSRNRFFNNKLQVNLEGFHWKYRNQQYVSVTFDDTGTVNALTKNAGSATVYGGNVDVVARPDKADTLHFAVEYAHSKYSSFDLRLPALLYNPSATGCSYSSTVPGPFVPLAVLNCNGFQLPHAPTWSGSAEVIHTFFFGNGATLDLQVGARVSGKTWLATDFTPAERAPSFVMGNASVTYHPTEKLAFTAFVRNFNNAKEYTAAEQESFAPPLVGAVISPPRTFGVRANATF